MSCYYMGQKDALCPKCGAIGSFRNGACMLDGTNQYPTEDEIRVIQLEKDAKVSYKGDVTKPCPGCGRFKSFDTSGVCWADDIPQFPSESVEKWLF